LLGYDALSAGLVMSPAGVFALLAMPIVGFILGRRMDARWLIAAGLLAMTVGNYWMSRLNLDISPKLSGPGWFWSQGWRCVLLPRTSQHTSTHPGSYAERLSVC
jgi:hypothetical protein